jgi:hypothetical protein
MGVIVLFDPRSGGLDDFSYFASSLFTNAREPVRRLAIASANRAGAGRAFSSVEPIASTNALFSRAVASAGRCAGAEDAEPGVDVEAAEAERLPASAIVGTSGMALERAGRRDGERLELAGLDVGRRGGEVVEVQVDLAAEQRSCAGLPPA